MNKRHIHNHGFKLTLTVLLTALLMAGHVSAQVTVKGNVYGGGNLANVQGAVEVNIKGGQIGDVTIDADHGNVYGGGALANTNTDNWDNSTLTDDPYISITITEETDLTGYYTRTGAAAPYTYTPATGTASSGTYYKRRETKVNLTGGTIKGDAYGGGLGRLADPEHGIEAKIATEYGDVLVTVAGTKMVTGTNHGRVFGANNINGTPKGHVKVLVQKTTAVDGQSIDVAAVFGGGNQAAYNPYSATEKAEVEINKASGEGINLIVGNVFGGGNEAGTENTAGTEVKIMAGNVKTGVYGGCNTSGTVSGDTKVTVTGGTIGTAWENAPATFPTLVFGGGLGQETLVSGSVTVELGAMAAAVAPATDPTISGDATIWGDVYGGSAKGIVNAEWTGSPAALTPTADKTTSVVFYSGTVNGNLYGGGLGDATHAADVYGDITVNIGTGIVNEGVMTTYGNATINGSIFGCNNTKGTPKGDVLVNVYKTAHTTGDNNNRYQYDADEAVENLELGDDHDYLYAIQAVYGGGNLAHYTPDALTGSDRHSTTVHVYVCDENTVKAVYGGGNAANVGTDDVKANTNVIIEGGRFYTVFGGGNGAGDENPGANIKGTAKTEIKGGLFNQIFGGSDTKGNVDVVDLSIESESGCILKVNESFGGANMSDLTGDVITTLTCSDDITIGNFYGGSNQADITGNVTLNVYGGNFRNVFGGSKGKIVAADASEAVKEAASADISGNVTLNLYGGTITENAYGGSNINGRIGGKITVNVLDNGGICALNVVGNIYGAGNVTPYTPTYTPDSGTEHISPVVNLIHGTVANVFGGARGETATVTASPQVNIGYDATTMGDLSTSGTLLYSITRDVTNYTSTTAPADFAAVVTGNVYGGGDLAQVTGNTVVNLRKANSSVDYIFGGGNLANVSGNTTVNIINGTVSHDVYGGGAFANVGTSASDATQVNLSGGTVTGNVYGGGLGRNAVAAVPDDPSTPDVDESVAAVSAVAALVNGAVTVTVTGGKATSVYGANNINGAPQSTVTVNVTGTAAPVSPANYTITNVFGGGNQAAYTGTPTVSVTGSSYVENVYGGGNEASVGATNVTINTTANTENDTNSGIAKVYGGGNQAGVTGNTLVSMTGGNVNTAVYGGCNASGTVGGTSTVNVTGGTIGAAFASAPTSMDDVPQVLFGGGKGAATSITGLTTLNVGTKSGNTYTGSANIYGNVYGGSENGAVSAVDVKLYGNTIYGNVFGGGYDTDESLAPEGTLAKHAPAAGVVDVLLDGTAFDRTYADNAYMAQVFGCNNKNGTPTGLVTVNVKRTVGCDKSNSSTPIADRNVYDVYAVYGGGNMADYKPTNLVDNGNIKGDSTLVLIEGCDLTSIKYVYGGGNAAAVPASGVSIKGTYIIYNVFGGGNGAGTGNPGANVGSYITTGTSTQSYGRGTAVTQLYGGTINEVFGGSNTLGNVRKVIVETKTPEGSTPDCCARLNVINVYGAGSEAEMTGDVSIIMECMPEEYVEAVYGGAKNAIINGNVMLVVTSGKYGRVFGGNNAGGSINGTISVVAKEEGCKPLEIGELYGGGNQAPYSKYGCEKVGNNWIPNTSGTDHTIPEGQTTPAPYAIDVLVESCTSIGKVFGGGNQAEVIGDTHVEINMFRGTTDDAPATLRPLGRIGQVFGGGNLAKVTGKTTIDIGTDEEYKVGNDPVEENQKKGVNIVSGTYINPLANNTITISEAGVYGGGNAADVEGDTEVNIGTANQSLGINITGDIFGGGYGETTHVTGDARVNIGKVVTGEPTTYVGYATITGDVYGGSAKGKVNSYLNNSSVETLTTGATTQVNLYGGTITGTGKGNIYGGGLGDNDHAANVYGPVAVNVYGGTANNVFGCNNVNGAPQNTVNVTMNGGTINNSIYGGGNQAAYTVENNPNKDQANAYKKYPVVNINHGTVTGDVFGGGYGLTATVTGSPQVTIGDNVNDHTAIIRQSVYGGGELAGVDYNTNIRVLKGAIGDATGVNAGETYGNVYGAGKGALNNVDAGVVKGNTNITISGGNIYHNIYGGGAYGSVGTITRGAATYVPGKASVANMPTSWVRTEGSETGKATITITGGTIGINGHENGMVFGSSRGNVTTPEGSPAVDPNDLLAWVYDTEVNIGTQVDETDGPTIKGSIYGSGENGHVYHDTDVKIHSGIIGITDTNIDGGAAYTRRGNVYGGGCGEDTYKVGDVDTYNPLAGIVLGTANVTMDGGHVVHNVYGAGALGSVGTMTSITISGGTVGVDGTAGEGNVFGAARGDENTTQTGVALVKTTGVTISGTADIKGNVYGGGEIGDVGTYTTSADGTNTYPEGSGACAVTVSGGTVRGNVFGAGKGKANTYTCLKAMVNSTSVTISNGTVERNVYGGGEIGRVENNTVVAISAGEILGSVFGAGQGVNTHGYSGLVRGNSTVTIEGSAKVRQNVYGGGETATVGKYWVKGADYTGVSDVPSPPEGWPSGMPYATRAGGVCTVTIQGSAQVGPDAGASETEGHVFAAGQGVEPSYTSGVSKRMNSDGYVIFSDPSGEADYLQFLETLALVSYANVTIGGNATVKGNVYGGSESGFVQDNTQVQVQGGTIEGNVFGGGKGLPTFTEAGKVKGATNVAISGGTTNGNVYGGGQLGVVQQNVAVTVSGGQVINDVYGGGALANTNTDNWNTQGSAVEYVEVEGLTAGTTSVAGYYTRSESTPYTYTLITGTVVAAADGHYYKKRVVGDWATGKNVYNSTTEKYETTYKTTVDLTGGIVGNAYGGGLGDATHAANVYGDVEVTVNDPTKVSATSGNLVAFTKESESFTIGTTGYSVDVTGHVFGCNNINGTPTGNVTVHVFQTKYLDKDGVIHTDYHVPVGDDTETFEIQGVYGGGNQSDYLPADDKKTNVIIEGCQITSIKKVYGGGNSASVPATDVLIQSSYFIGYAFGGGNGGEHVKKSDGWHENEGAIVIGMASIACYGGKVGSVFGGSDAKGTCGGVSIDTKTQNPECPRIITRLYGAGNEADINGHVNMILSSCSGDEIEYVHGGSYNANVSGDVMLTITSGIYKNVYGGNDARGSIGGDITVNIEETDNCAKPIIIQNLVGGGNNAPYPGIKRDGTDVLDEHGNKRHGKITVNVKSATRIDNVYGGCFNAEADADTEVNINMRKGNMAGSENVTIPDKYKNLPNIKDVTTPSGGNVTCTIKNEIGTIGNVYGGGNEGLVKGKSIVNIGTSGTVDIMRRDSDGKVLDKDGKVISFNSGEMLAQNIEIGYVSETVEGAHITGDVYGGGNLAVVTGNTYVNICYDRENDTAVAEGTAGVKVGGSVYGGGNAADVQSNTFVRMENGYVYNGIFGGGYSGSVGTITARSLVNYDETAHTSHTDCVGGKPTAFAANTGKCTVVVNGGQIGPVEVATVGMPNPHGWVWGGGCGLIEDPADDPDVDFKTYVNETDVTIGGTAFIMEGVIGGGEFGRVLGSTLVKIKDHCQIGVGAGMAADGKPVRYTDGYNYGSGVTTNQFVDPTEVTITSGEGGNALAACSRFDFGRVVDGKKVYEIYDPYADKYPTLYPGGSTAHASNGGTWIGVVFGGGSGYMPYEKEENSGYDWIHSAGLVEGNTEVRISGGHVLTNVYGGNEYTDVKGTATVTMTGGTIGVPRTNAQIEASPLSGYLFGAGKGDPRPHFDTYTNVGSTVVNVSGGIIYGSVLGGAEDGHVLGNTSVTISGGTIGTWGTTYYEGNVFGGGRGFSGENLNSGSVGGTVTMNITGGTMLGSVYGGGRLGSVEGDITIGISGGTIGNSHEYTYDAANEVTHTKGGNVFAGGMGRMYQLDGTTPISAVDWWKLGNVKSTKLTISGTAQIKSNVYGGGELGMVKGTHTSADSKTVSTEIIIEGGTIGTEIQDGGVTQYTFGSVYGGGYGSLVEQLNHTGSTNPTYATYAYTYPKYIAGRVKNSTEVTMTAGTVLASVYGGGEMAAVGESTVLANPGENDPVVLGETLTGAGGTPLEANTYVIISGGTIGKTKDIEHSISFGGAKMGNVYGGGSGHNNTVRSGQIYGNTNVTISGTPTIYHNVYGGGAYGTVGDFEYEIGEDPETHTRKVFGVSDRSSYHANSGVANVTITGGTIGIDGYNNGMVFGSSRGDINQPGERDDHTAWVYDTHVTIGTANAGTSTPTIYGSVYGSGENGHTFNNTAVTVHSGTIGVVADPTVPNRGNVYGSGCGTDKYYENHALETHDGEGQLYNPLAGIVYGNATITIDGGEVVHNVYGGGSMGSVGKTNDTGVITSGGQTTINISGGQIGHNGTGNGNVYGAARGDEAITQDGFAQVKTTQVNINAGANVLGSVFGGGEAGRTQVDTHVNMSGGTVAQNVFGGGYLGNVGVIDKTDINNYKWANQVDDATQKTGICHVTVTGGTVGPANNANPTIGNVFGAGKGSGVTFQCENAMVYDANVTVSNGTVNGDVFGGGEVGRVENNTTVTIGAGTGEGSFTPHIYGDVFGGGKGLATHGYSALVRGNTEVSVQGNAQIAKNVFGGGEIASVGRYGLNAQKMPNILLDGGDCKVTVTGDAVIGPDLAGDQEGNVYGAGKGVDPQTFDKDNVDKPQRSRRMTMYTNATAFPEDKKGTTWEYIRTYSAAELSDNTITKFVWEYYQTKEDYASYLETLALATAPDVTIDGSANVNGSVFGGGEMGLTKGSVTVTILGGTIQKDVYGGGALANTNTTDQIGVSDGNGGYQKDGNGEYITTTMHSVTDVYLQGGLVYGDAYGGGLGQRGENPIEAKTFGEISVYLGGDKDGASTSATAFNITNYTGAHSDVVKSGRVFGCNNLNGSPQEDVTVTVWKTRQGNRPRTTAEVKASNKVIMKNHPENYATGGYGYVTPTYEVAAVYGGGNLASYTAAGKKTHVVIYGCDATSIETVYGGGNAAAVTETSVDIWSCYEIGTVFGGGNGKDDYTLDNGDHWTPNPGADITGNSADAEIKGTAATTWLYGGTIHEAYGGSNVKGTINGSVFIDVGDAGIEEDDPNYCELDLGKIAGAGKNADVNGDLIVIMGCKPSTYIPLVYGGADNANVKGNVELTLTSGNFGKVFGGNNLGGAIKGHIKLNIEETGNCATPLTIEELYLGGNEAAYSVYGYYNDGTVENPILKPRTAEMHAITDPEAEGYKAPHDNPTVDSNHPFPYAEPELNIISCTSIGQVFGGGLGSRGDMYASPTVNINMIPGSHANDALGGPHKLGAVGGGYTDMQNVKHEGGVYGGGNEATVHGNTTVNIGTATTVNVKSWSYNEETKVYTASDRPVEGANIVGDVYGGGNLADVTGNTYVNVCAYQADDNTTADVIEYKGVSITGTGYEGVTIKGNVFGGGKGTADSFTCAKAMIGVNLDNDGNTPITKESTNKGTRVSIGNGTIEGTVYGGGEIGRVEWNSVVTVGVPVGLTSEVGKTSCPEIKGDVYGAGKGIEQYGYAALVRGNTFVTVQDSAKVGLSVYGGGEISSVGKYNIVNGMPTSLANETSGYCNVIVRGNAEIGPDNMKMTATGGPDDFGHVFGAGRGILPYENEALFPDCPLHTGEKHPGRMAPPDADHPDGIWECYFDTEKNKVDEDAYLTFIETQGLATHTEVTIGGDAFVKGSVYGGSMDGHVQHDTHVTITGDCQIGAGYDESTGHSLAKYSGWPTETESITTSWAECAHWDYDPNSGAPYDMYATRLIDGKYYYDEKDAEGHYIYAEGGAPIAKDGHTWYGNVFGGGSGVIPYKPGKWHRAAGSVGGDTRVDITGGHILTSVYGGNEHTDVGTYTNNDQGYPINWVSGGKCTINMTGGTIGVPRTEADAKLHPVTCYLFGAGKGDQRIFFNTWTNVQETEVNVSGTARIYGSVLGGGEDGHILGDAAVNIGDTVKIDLNNDGDTTDEGETFTPQESLKIGTTGTSYVDGNVFGGGRGFSGAALTAGSTGGNVTMNIAGGTMLGSVYGGGRLASVGIDFTPADNPSYGQLVDDTNDKTHGHISIVISGGTIGNGTTESGTDHPVSGNVFGGSMGRITLLDGTLNPLWPKEAVVKLTEVSVSGGTIYNSVYGGSELGIVRNRAIVNVSGTADIRGNVFGGGYGSNQQDKTTIVAGGYASIPTMYYTFTPMIWTGCVSGDTYVNIAGGKIGKNVYGGGDMASVGLINYNSNEAGTEYNYITKHEDLTNGFGLSWPYQFQYIQAAPNDPAAIGGGAIGGKATINITGGRIGTTTGSGYGNVFGGSKGMVSLLKEDNETLITDVNEQRYAEAFCANVRETKVNINYASTPESDDGSTTACIVGAVYGGGQDGHVYENAAVSITGGYIGLSVYGGGQGESTFMGKLRDQSTGEWKATTEAVHSITAGKVYGNTSVSMSDGLVIGHVYGGGNLASVGKGNYASGSDDYYPDGYGEKISTALFTPSDEFNPDAAITEANKPKTMADHFLSSGNTIVSITGGKVGTLNGTSGTVYGTSEVTPTGMVFGGSRGRAAQDIMLDPRHEYAPDFYLGYVNSTSVTIGTESSGRPRIYSQVFGGGRDGHVRNSTHVIINDGTIGQTYAETTAVSGSTADYQRYHRGNVYGSGSGLGLWNAVNHGMSSGSVTRNTTVDINGGTIYNNVYGGGALSSVGPPRIDLTKDYAADTYSKCTVNINGGTIGDHTVYNTNKYGSCVYGASRGNDFAAGESTKDFATVLWTDVNINGGDIAGNVYGGGETGDVKGSTDLSMTGGTVGHNVYGGGKGDGTLFDCSKAMVGIDGDGAGKEPGSDENKDKGTKVTISNGIVNGNVYGGGEIGRVEWNTQVTVGEKSGDGTPKVEGSVFGAGKGLETHGYSALVRGNCTVTVQGAAKIGQNVYGGGEKATAGRYWVKNRNNKDAQGNVIEAAKPVPEDLPDGMPYKQQSGGICTVTIQGNAEIGYNGAADDAGHVYGAGQGVDSPYVASGEGKSQKKVDDGELQGFADEAAYLEFLETLALVTNANVTIDGSAQVKGNVYGGSESGFVQHDTNVTVQNGTIGTEIQDNGITKYTFGKVFGGGKGLTTFTEAGKVKENTTVNILGGTMYGDVYGGGALGKSNTAVDNGVYPTATVNLLGGTITGDAYGGGLGDADSNTAADVGNTVVNLNGIDKSFYDATDATMKTVFDELINKPEGATTYPLKLTKTGCIVDRVFGANNVNGTPLGHAKVHVFATQNANTSSLPSIDDKSEAVYDMTAVFGGGNASDYVPASTDAKQSTEVIIEGCDLTSIQDVYGGGYGAAVPATEVLIKGTYIIDNVFGGGYGAGVGNPGANVGKLTGGGSYGETVTGKANVKLMAGRIHHVFGASNTKGDILGGSSVTTVAKETPAGECKPICENLDVDDIFGGGKEAPMEGGTEVVLGCMPNDWVDEIYAGAESADVGNDVSLTITSGKFGRVFGGNKSGGILDGGITVHIEENPNCDTPIVIGELYGGGNEARYSAYGYKKVGDVWTLLKDGDEGANASACPVVVHAKAFTSIGKIFGGGKGSAATLIGNPWVLVDEVEGGRTFVSDDAAENRAVTQSDGTLLKTLSDDTNVTLYPRASTGTMGVVGTIFGGGNEAEVEGNTTVKIASYDYVVFWSAPELDDVRGFYTRTGDGEETPYEYTEVTGAAAVPPVANTIYYKKVAGADIRGNIYGGGNNAEVTGATNVVIGRKD